MWIVNIKMSEIKKMENIYLPKDLVLHIESFIFDEKGYNLILEKNKHKKKILRIRAELCYFEWERRETVAEKCCSRENFMDWYGMREGNSSSKKFMRLLKLSSMPTITYHTGMYCDLVEELEIFHYWMSNKLNNPDINTLERLFICEEHIKGQGGLDDVFAMLDNST